MNAINDGRRSFLKKLGASATLVLTTSCAKETTAIDSAGLSLAETQKENMTMRHNPKTGEAVSILGYGCMRWPTTDDDQIDQEQVNRLVDYAIEHGVNYFDTSPAYCKGQSEHATGIALSRHPRDSYYIATKLSNWGEPTWTPEASREMYYNSMRELQVDYIDYMLLHGIGMGGMEAMENRYYKNGILDFLLKEREAGRIRNLGFSYHGAIECFDYLLSRHDEYQWDFVQIQLNYVDWLHSKEVNPRNTNAQYLYNELQKRNIPAIIMEPLLGGRLSKLHDHIVAKLKQREPERSVASWAFRYAGTFPGVLTVLSGMTYLEHLKDNLTAYAPLTPLTDDEMMFLEEIAQQLVSYQTIPCNDCKYCMPCPYGIDIPANLLHYNKCINKGELPRELDMTADAKTYQKNRRNFLISYDRNVPRERQARFCVGCDQCSPHCPQRINIPRELMKIDRFVEKLLAQK